VQIITGMATITLDYDARNVSIRKAFELLFTLGVRAKNSVGYDTAFVSKIKNAEKEPSKKLNLTDYGISI
jgi:hypothetical protein